MDNINVTPQYCLAGEATFTVSNGAGGHRTYHIYHSKPNGLYLQCYFIKMLVGADNTLSEDYSYMGRLEFPHGNTKSDPIIKMTSKSRWTEGTQPVVIAKWALRAIWQVARGTYKLPVGYSIKHIGRCGRCGRPLTTPESLDTGLGPDCASQLGIEWKERNERQPELEGVKK